MRLSTMGFMQYLAPTGQFLLAVLAFGEPFTRTHMITFGLIWTALLVYSIDTIRGLQAAPQPGDDDRVDQGRRRRLHGHPPGTRRQAP